MPGDQEEDQLTIRTGQGQQIFGIKAEVAVCNTIVKLSS